MDDAQVVPLVMALLESTELQRLRNMRQMNFDVPLIQELGRSRRLPHSIGVAWLALTLAHRNGLSEVDRKTLVAAALLHDGAIPPYGHLVEAEFKHAGVDFRHEDALRYLILGGEEEGDFYRELLPNRYPEVSEVLEKYNVVPRHVFELVCPKDRGATPITADVDLDNIDNVHRMAVLLGMRGAKENAAKLAAGITLDTFSRMRFAEDASKPLEVWLDFRQQIYTMIIAHPQCIPHNAFQSDLVRAAVNNNLITATDWFLSEPEFEERLRQDDVTKDLAAQLLSGCEYALIDYVWLKDIPSERKLARSDVEEKLENGVVAPVSDHSYFIWSERGLISRELRWDDALGVSHRTGKTSSSCMVALLRRSARVGRDVTAAQKTKWREQTLAALFDLVGADTLAVDYPEDYVGSYFSKPQYDLSLSV